MPDLGAADMREIYQLREALDAMAAALAADGEHADAKADELGRMCDAQEAQLEHGDIDAYREIDVDFHRALWHASGNSRILRAGEPLLDQMLLSNALSARQPGRGAQSVGEHRGIVEAIRRGDAEDAVRRARDHIRQSHQSFVAAITE